MKKILSTSIKNVKSVLVIVTFAIAFNLIVEGHFELLPAVFIGYVLATAFIISTAARLSSTIGLTKDQAKRRMLLGLLLKLLMLWIVLLVGLKISELVFFSMVTGFLSFYLVAQLGLIMTSYKNNYHNDDVDGK